MEKKSPILRISAILLAIVALALGITIENKTIAIIFLFVAMILNCIAVFDKRKKSKSEIEKENAIKEIQAKVLLEKEQEERDKKIREELNRKRREQAQREQENKREDWICPKCAILNPGKNNFCQHCGYQKSIL